MNISDITATDLQDDKIAPIIFKEYREQVTKRMKDVGYMNILAGYIRFIFQDFGCHLRTETGLVEDDIKMVLDEFNSSFITYELKPGIYTHKDFSESVFNIVQLEFVASINVIVLESDDVKNYDIVS